MSYCSRSRRRRFTVLGLKIEHIVAFTAIFSNICTAYAQKRLHMNFWCKFRHRRSIRRPRFPVRVQNFGDLATFSVDYYIIYSECPPYSYFRFVWPKGHLLSSVTNAKALDCVNFLCVTLWPWPLTFWPWTILVHGGSRDQPSHQVRRPHAYPFVIYEL